MARVIISMVGLGDDLMRIVRTFCGGTGQQGKEMEIFHELMSQMVGIQSTNKVTFTYNLLQIPMFVPLFYVEEQAHHQTFKDMLFNEVRRIAVLLDNEFTQQFEVHQVKLTHDVQFLLESVSTTTLVVSLHANHMDATLS